MKIFHPNISFTSLSVWKHKISAPHVKFSGNFKGMLIYATNQDSNGAIFFLAHALVSKEEEVNWLYFVRHFRNTEAANSIVFFMSDRDKGLIDAARKVFPDIHHSKFLYHMSDNFKKKFDQQNTDS